MKKKKVRKLKKRFKIILILVLLVLIVGCVFKFTNFSFLKKTTKTTKSVTKVKKDEPKEYSLKMLMVGDALIHSAIYTDAKQSDGSYDFKPMLQYIKPISSTYDIAYYNQETILGGASLGYSNYPLFNSPTEVGDAMLDAGFNMVSLATNHTLDKGEQGVLNSVSYWSTKTNVVWDGQRASQEERDKVRTYKKNGISYAFFSYTTVTNGLNPPTGKDYLTNIYSPEKAAADIAKVTGKVDVIIVAMHWGTEYSNGVSDEQTTIANYLASLGVNIIIGAHPHVIEPVEYINNGKTFVIYSLGNFISDQEGIERLSGLMMELTIKKVVKDKVSTITVENPHGEIIYTKSNRYIPRQFRVYPYSKLDSNILANYSSYYEQYKAIANSRYPELVWGVDGE
jgi:poly-gamma-glutamate capsule biosynthesis protein CapA/YwtB (metallophosphatase superfamily)